MKPFLTKIQELWLHQLWLEKQLHLNPLQNHEGLPIRVIHPGWYNRGWGPDFKEAKVTIGETSLFGDIEFHINEGDWFQHQHHLDPRYNKVILHIYLFEGRRAAMNQLHQPIENVCLNRLPHFSTAYLDPLKDQEILVKETPGACGLAIREHELKKVEQLIHQAAENRLVKKSETILPLLTPSFESNEDLFYSHLCKALGHIAESDLFWDISQQVPYQHLKRIFESNYRESRVEFFSIWFQLSGVLEEISRKTVHDDIRREMLAIYQKVEQDGEKALATAIKKYPSRPHNKLFRRIAGLYHHLEIVRHDGLLKSWLRMIYRIAETISKQSRAKTLAQLDELFPTPDWDPFSHLFSLEHSKAKASSRFIGKNRQLIIFINAVIPFFLAWARYHKDLALEKKIFLIYMSLPSEGENQKTRFLKKRLGGSIPLKFRNILPQTQGLIQIYQDCCSNFYEGCENCSFLKILNSRLEKKVKLH